MKKSLIFLVILLLSKVCVAQSLEELLQKTFGDFERTDTLAQKMVLANRFDLIASKWDTAWIAHYYSAYSKTIISFLLNEEKQRDAVLDRADQSFQKAKTLLHSENAEILVLEAYIANARLAVKPMSRYKKYGDVFDARLEAAAKINAQNPRIYYLKGLSIYHTPKAFGGGATRALPYFEKASELFKYEQQDDLAKPFWGKNKNEYFLDQCKGSN